ncbi:MAG: polyprenyl synthetase family protein, partial [Bacillota bacterium]|nr:polyprenyl synthetase family protein [Bacillota bacterium]
RGLPTVHRLWGTKAGVLAGDYLFARAFSILARDGGPQVVERMAQVISDLASGELHQQNSLYCLDQSEEDYLLRIHQKTASFLGECCRIAGIVTGGGEATQEALYRFGQRIGMGFQVIDDILDLTGDSTTLGKPAASDLAAGILTLPVIYGLKDGELGPQLREFLQDPPWGRTKVEEARHLLLTSEAIGYTYKKAREFTEEGQKALASLPPGAARETLEDLARILLLRLL